MADVALVITGALLLAGGVVLYFMAVLFLPFLCIGPASALVGFILLIHGAVKEEPRPVYANLPPGYASAPPTLYCPQCGSLLQWVIPYQQGFCARCRVYR